MKIHPGFGRVVDAYARGEEISVRCTDEDCVSDQGVPKDLRCVDAVDELAVDIGGHVYWSGSTEVVD